MKLGLILALGLSVVGTLCSGAVLSSGTVVYSDKEFGFRVEYPSAWTSKEFQGRMPAGAYERLTIMLTDGNDVSLCAFSVTLFPGSKQYPISDIIARMLESALFEEVLRETMPNGRLLSIQRGLFGGQDAAIAIVANTVPIKTFLIHHKGIMATTVRNGHVYRGFCYTDETAFSKMEKPLRSILGTFSFS